MTAVETGSSLDREMIANFPAMLPGLAFQTYIRKNIDVKKAPLALQPLCFFSPRCTATEDYAALCDVFYLGGTKCGALFGEAVVITNDDLKPDFRYCLKQHGGMLAKGRLLGEQFLALLDGEDGSGSSLYFTMAKKADEQALRIRAAFEAKGCKVLHDSPTNQQFFVLPDEWYDKLAETYAMTHMGKPDKHHTAVRVCTSWATKDEAVEQLIQDVATL